MKPWAAGVDPERDIAVLMSGGVDSSVTALTLKEAGWNVVGITMRLPVAESCNFKRSCCGMEAAYVCRDLEIPHYFLDVREEFREHVIEAFRRAYAAGLTPSPCVECNTVFKFGMVWDFIEREMGIDRIATGHYAQIKEVDGTWSLARAAQKIRDQSYFLYGIKAERLKHLALPLGGMNKEDVRQKAAESRLPVARRQDSMELCFAGEGDYRNALGAAGREPGNIVDPQGRVIGRHAGIAITLTASAGAGGSPRRSRFMCSGSGPNATRLSPAPRPMR
jgi:tRNA-specific 2-thiouridylase